jgi:hypothetical protein
MFIKQQITLALRRITLVKLVSLCLTGILLLSACAPTEVPTEPPQPPTSIPPQQPTAPPAPTLGGTYTVNFTKDELAQAGVTEHELCENAGLHEITFSANGWTWKQTPPEDCTDIQASTGTGTWRLIGSQFTFIEPPAFGCEPTATYTLNIEGDALIFTVLEDTCRYRVILLTTHPWEKVQ